LKWYSLCGLENRGPCRGEEGGGKNKGGKGEEDEGSKMKGVKLTASTRGGIFKKKIITGEFKTAGSVPGRQGQGRKRSFDLSRKLPEREWDPVVKRLAVTCLIGVLGSAMLPAPPPGKFEVTLASAEAAGFESENAASACELRKEKESIEKKRLNAREWVQKGMDYFGSKNYEGARKAFGHAIEINEGFIQLYDRAAAMHMRYGNQRQANDYLKKMDDLESDLGLAYYHRGLACRETGRDQEAIFDFDRAVKHDSNYCPAYLERGRVYQKLGDYRQAIDNYNAVVKRDPGNAAAYCERSSAYTGLEFFRLAVMDCNKAIELDPKYARAYVERGKSYQGLGNTDKGIENFKIAAALGSQEAQDWLKAKGIPW
jgi:Tfp pilus assembly protein PilF